MNCPLCINQTLDVTFHGGIEVDICPNCRGVWLDRGELEKLAGAVPAPPVPSGRFAADGSNQGRSDVKNRDEGRDRDEERYTERSKERSKDRDRDGKKKKRKKSKKSRLADALGDVLEEVLDL